MDEIYSELTNGKAQRSRDKRIVGFSARLSQLLNHYPEKIKPINQGRVQDLVRVGGATAASWSNWLSNDKEIVPPLARITDEIANLLDYLEVDNPGKYSAWLLFGERAVGGNPLKPTATTLSAAKITRLNQVFNKALDNLEIPLDSLSNDQLDEFWKRIADHAEKEGIENTGYKTVIYHLIEISRQDY